MEIYTVGHSSLRIEEFLRLLVKYSINCICDVRSTPYSKFADQYNKDIIKGYLIKIWSTVNLIDVTAGQVTLGVKV